MDNLKNQRIWITGASRGIGGALFERLCGSDAVIVASASSEASFSELSEKYSNRKQILFLPFNMAESGEINKAYDEIIDFCGGVDILINNAGIAIFNKFVETAESDFDKMMNINLKGAFLSMQKVLPGMIERNKGLIANISSVSAITVFKNCSVYSATKSALLMMSRCIREEVKNKGIRVIDILPGATLTDIWQAETKEKFAEKMMKPSETAEIIFNSIIQSLTGKAVIEEIIIRPNTGDL